MSRPKKSIIQAGKTCMVCGSPNVERHHVFYGTANRILSENYGLVIYLCPEHHRGNYSAHNTKELDLLFKQMGQRAFERTHSREEFREIFGKNYLE